MIRNDVIDALNSIKRNNGIIIKGKMADPKYSLSPLFGPFSIQTYFNNRDIANIVPVWSEMDFGRTIFDLPNPFNNPGWVRRVIDIAEAEKWCRCDLTPLSPDKIIFWRYRDTYDMHVEVHKGNSSFKLMVFPHQDSNVAVFCNKAGEHSFVIDGRCEIYNGRPYIVSTNQEAIKKWLDQAEVIKTQEEKLDDDKAEKDDRIKSFSRVLTKEMWNLKDEDSALDEDEKEVVKSVVFIEKTKYVDFPRMEDGTPHNVIWFNDHKRTLYHFARRSNILKKYIRYSSLSQNGVSAFCGPVGELTDKGWEVNECKQFRGDIGKFDISATQGFKYFKAFNNTQRILVCLAELVPVGNKLADNIMGNCMASFSASETYMTDLTREKAKLVRVVNPAHKVFVRTFGETVRVKGATRIYSDMELFATKADGTIENKILVLPPREVNPKGIFELDTKKFKFLCKFRDDKSKLQMVTITFQGRSYNVPALYCEVVEDAHHSAVYSLKDKERNMFYYGCIKHLIRMNGFDKVAKVLSQMLDHKMLAQAMNISKIEKSSVKEVALDDFFDNLTIKEIKKK